MPVFRTDAVDLAYDDTGQGSPPLLFLHGFSCARTDFAHQFDAFSARHRVVAFDQRGHGDSSLARDNWYGFEATAHDARALCAALGVDRPVVIGHSLGGVSALLLAQPPAFASALVLLDSTVEIPAELAVELAAYADRLHGLSEGEFRDEVRAYARYRMIDPSDDPELAAALIERASTVAKDAYVLGVRSIVGVDVAQMAAAVQVPALFIASSMPWLSPERIHELLPGWYLGRTVGAGHFHQLFVPTQVNAMLGRFLTAINAGFTRPAVSTW
jgi:pimeloyl-ACP methyl ester carboxylesterase